MNESLLHLASEGQNRTFLHDSLASLKAHSKKEEERTVRTNKGSGRRILERYRSSVSGRNLRKDAGYGRPIIAMANSPRCTFNGKPIEDGKSVSSPEPCLNCTCSKGILLCYLHTCNSVAPVQGCQIVKKPGTCCPQLECGDFPAQSNDLRPNFLNELSLKYRLRQDEDSFFGLLPMDPRTDRSILVPPTPRGPSAFVKGSSKGQRRSQDPQDSQYDEQQEDYAEDVLDRNNSTGYCISRGYKYLEGMAMLSPTKCEYCYCIGGQQMCVRPKCHLSIEGCVPRYQSGYTCCPSHYNCDIPAGGSSIDNIDENYHLIPTNDTQYKTKVTSCHVEGYDYNIGVAVPSSGHCQTCYCTKRGVICRRLECAPTVPGCTPVVPEGHCCPTQYKCDQKVVNSTHVPVSHSTDNYDVTVISPAESKNGTPTQTSRTENPDIFTNSDQETSTTDTGESDATTETGHDKQKITVELSEESDLESISVIPEENIAVLVLTTSREDSESSPSTSTKSDNESSTYEEESKITETISSANSKRKFKPTKPIVKNPNRNTSRLSTISAVTEPITVTLDNRETTLETSSTDEEKNNYAYDYVEYVDDESSNTLQTFDPFSEYSEQPHDETVSIERNKDGLSIADIQYKIKDKKPPINDIFNKPLSDSFETGVPEEHPDYRNTKTSTKSDQSVHSTLFKNDNEHNFSDIPGRYTIYSTDHTKPASDDYSDYSSTGQNFKQKHRRPGIVTRYQTTYLKPQSTKPYTSSSITSEDVRTAQTIPYDPTADRNTYTAESFTQTYAPDFTNKKKISNRRRRPETVPQTTSSRQSTKPIPQDIADFLWSITQSQNTQTVPTIKDGAETTVKSSYGQGFVSETLSPIALAAPKLILEESTSKSAYETTQTESTNTPPSPGSPVFNFEPEIIFSNHGPNRNQKPPNKDPQVPLIINNHKKTSTRIRPPIRFRPPSTTTSVEDSFVEISNHRPTYPQRRPPSQFPPYPHAVHRPDYGYNRDPHFRDSHPKLHRFEGETPWSDDYEEYSYNTDHDISSTTKTYSNIHKQPTETETTNTDYTESKPKISKTSPENDSSTTDELRSTQSEKYNESKVSLQSENETEKPSIDTTTGKITTMPFSKSTYYLPTVTTTTATPYDTTKSFSGYVRNKYKGVSSHGVNTDGKFFRAEEEIKRWDSDHRLIEITKKQTETSKDYTQQFSKSPLPSSTESPISSPKVEEDSKEISDVCFVDGRYYTSGETIIKANPCEMCSCFYGHPLCQVQQCPPPPDPSCALDYLPGYCCPRVTCGVETDPEQPPGIVSASLPEPTSQEFLAPSVQDENQWKPLHGPITRTTTESSFQVGSLTEKTQFEDKPEEVTEFSNVPEKIPSFKNHLEVSAAESKFEPSDALIVSYSVTVPPTTTRSTSFPTTSIPTTTPLITTQPSYEEKTTTISPVTQDPTTRLPSTTTEAISTTTEDYAVTTTNDDYTTTEIPRRTTTWVSSGGSTIVRENEIETANKGHQNKSLIHDNSSGVRKVLDEVITLPASKVALSDSMSDSKIHTVLPVIGTKAPPTTISADEVFGIESATFGSVDMAGLSTDLGNLKISGCNVYGKYYRINDKVPSLGKSCSECICTEEGISCSPTC
ncbi:hypothetical protein JTE90_000524 [Oedothorax gibbosus]|uniref:VWFC domain-containing protein n=1 Tax=Oedothorax gibbosus TaxID=931172 RepID=A0AAV6VY09_9ARAC|nr:hypothetical protein JTE90_000524 [Oedothorax gibbosus]